MVVVVAAIGRTKPQGQRVGQEDLERWDGQVQQSDEDGAALPIQVHLRRVWGLGFRV